MGDVQRCPPFYYVQDTPVCHRFMLIASYACGYSRGSCVQGVAAADQLAEALAYVKNTLGQDPESTVSIVDERPAVSPLARTGIQALIDWVRQHTGQVVVIVVADCKWLFGTCEEESGRLVAELRAELHFVRQRTIVPDAGIERHERLLTLIRASTLAHRSDDRLRCHRRKRMMKGNVRDEAWYGYRQGRHPAGEWIPHEEELRIVHRMHDLDLAGFTPVNIAQYLNRRGVQRNDGLPQWTKTQLIKILQRGRPKDFADVHGYRSPEFARWAAARIQHWPDSCTVT
jgi:hypothetical protein